MSPKDQEFFDQLGQRIAKLRRHRKIEQADLGRLIGYGQQHVSSIENGRSKIPADKLVVLAEFFHVTLDELLGVKPLPKRSRYGPVLRLRNALEALGARPRRQHDWIAERLEELLEQAQAEEAEHQAARQADRR